MSIINRFINIVKLNLSDKTGDSPNSAQFTPEQIEALLADDSDDDLKNIINSLPTNNDIPTDINTAFDTLGIKPTSDMNTVTAVFRRKMQMLHPDKNTGAEEQKQNELQAKTVAIIKAYTIIKEWTNTKNSIK